MRFRIIFILFIISILQYIACSKDEITNSLIIKPQLSIESSTSAYVNQEYNLVIRAGNEDLFDIELSQNPNNAVFIVNNDGTSTLNWLPDSSDIGVYPITAYAINKQNSSFTDSLEFEITVSYPPTSVSVWNPYENYWETTLSLYDSIGMIYFSFQNGDTIETSTKGSMHWSLGFRREEIVLNDTLVGASNNISYAVGLNGVDFSFASASDTTFKYWQTNNIAYAIDEWLFYNHPSKSLSSSSKIFVFPYIYFLQDAEGDNFLMFRIDSVRNVKELNEMGDVYLSYVLADGTTFNIDSIKQLAMQIGTGIGYVDFSSGERVYPPDPGNSTLWDIAFYQQKLRMNSSIFGNGQVQMFPAYIGSTDSTDFAIYNEIDYSRRFYKDFYWNPFIYSYERFYNRGWYELDLPNGSFTPREITYLIRTEGRYFKMQIINYSSTAINNQLGGDLTFRWLEL